MKSCLGFFIFSIFWGSLTFAVELTIQNFENNKVMSLRGPIQGVQPGQVMAIRSQTPDVGIIAYARIISVDLAGTARAEIVRTSEYNLVRSGDQVIKFDLSKGTEDYIGGTELLVREDAPAISTRYKPLFTQGILIGETAQTLWRNEFLFTWYGLGYFGLFDWLSIGSLLTDDLKAPNLTFKARLMDTASNTIATGITVRRIPDQNRYTLNLNLMWDSFNNGKSMSHTFATLAIYSIENAEDTTAFKSAGTSTFQTGYEYILDGWSRILYGPNYNFETKAIGGYFAYAKIWDHFHLQGTVYASNIRSLRWSINDGYIVYLDAYWRF